VTAALLDQRNMAGIGNMYAAELCFTSASTRRCRA
jgi:formamidopyrimidine-DNA glycosylase